jgi:hypothetical protein
MLAWRLSKTAWKAEIDWDKCYVRSGFKWSCIIKLNPHFCCGNLGGRGSTDTCMWGLNICFNRRAKFLGHGKLITSFVGACACNSTSGDCSWRELRLPTLSSSEWNCLNVGICWCKVYLKEVLYTLKFFVAISSECNPPSMGDYCCLVWLNSIWSSKKNLAFISKTSSSGCTCLQLFVSFKCPAQAMCGASPEEILWVFSTCGLSSHCTGS